MIDLSTLSVSMMNSPSVFKAQAVYESGTQRGQDGLVIGQIESILYTGEWFKLRVAGEDFFVSPGTQIYTSVAAYMVGEDKKEDEI